MKASSSDEINCLRDVPYYARGVVRFAVDIERSGCRFEYGLYFSVVKSNVTSRKFTTFLLASTVIRRLFLANTLHISFLIFSIFLWGLVDYC